MDTDTLTQKSKYLAYVLRHRPDVAGLILDKEGWTPVDDVVAATGVSKADLEQIVGLDEKGRYSFSSDGLKVRANQGHSAQGVKMTFKRAVPPTVLYHGTTSKAELGIMKKGLLPMNRHHVHLSEDIEVARSVAGRRKSDIAILQIDTKQMLADKFQFYLSDNGVWLVDSVPTKYITVMK